MTNMVWNGNTADWSVTGDWAADSGGTGDSTNPPGSGTPDNQTAELNGLASNYTVTISSAESYNLAELQIAGDLDAALLYTTTLDIDGSLTVGTLDFSAALSLLNDAIINVEAGGTLDVTSAIDDSTLELGSNDTINVAGTGAGGTLELGNTDVENSHVGINFTNNGSGVNDGTVEYLSDSDGTTISQSFTNVAWGDQIIVDGLNLTGDTATYSGDTLTIQNGATTVLTLNDVSGTGLTSGSFVLSGNSIDVVCFAAGTRILTEAGEKPVEALVPGDMVITAGGDAARSRPVKWIGRRWINIAAHPKPQSVAPIRIERGAFANNVPKRDLLVSPDHAIFVDGTLICARLLINGSTIRRETHLERVAYFHVELDTHSVLLAEGLPAESYLDTDNRAFFSNSGLCVLFPDLTSDRDIPIREAKSCHPFVSDLAHVLPVWQRLADRAAAQGRAWTAGETTRDAEPHLHAQGRTIRPWRADHGIYTFVLPLGCREARLESRACQPADLRPWLDDRRDLGVSVKRIMVYGTSGKSEIPVDHPSLTTGWWDVERHGNHAQRWTNGAAILPLPASPGQLVLELHLDTAEYPVATSASRAA